VPDLIKTLQDDNDRVRGFAVYALSEIGPDARAAASPLLALLKHDKDPDVRVKCARGLPLIQADAKTAVPALIEALKDANAEVREASVFGLGKYGPAAKEAVPALREIEQDPDPDVREAVTKALSRIQGGR
jgi:HEAT repeat protein